MNKPFFTVVIPTYNRADLLPLSIDSVLQQTYQDFEIIVVDNFSSDNTQHVMQDYLRDPRIRYCRNDQNMERAYSRNVGFRHAKGAFLTLLDSDDVMYSTCLEDAKAFSSEHPEKRVFHNLYETIDHAGRSVKQKRFEPISNQYKQICQSNFLSCIGVFLSSDVYQQFFFTEDLKMIGSEDYEIWFRVLGHFEVGRINKVNCGVREHLGRSVYTSMYDNLEYQRQELVHLIESSEIYRLIYKEYIGYVNANYYYHQAMYSLYKNERKLAWGQFCLTVTKGHGFLFSRRFFGFIKNYLLNKTSNEKNSNYRWVWIFRSPSWQKVK